jgi:hypothetical protein
LLLLDVQVKMLIRREENFIMHILSNDGCERFSPIRIINFHCGIFQVVGESSLLDRMAELGEYVSAGRPQKPVLQVLLM